jgi:hypothetical protein
VNKIARIKIYLLPLIEEARKALDIRDFLVYGGLFSLSYGFYQLFPWLGWVIFGIFSMLLGLGWLFRLPKGAR